MTSLSKRILYFIIYIAVYVSNLWKTFKMWMFKGKTLYKVHNKRIHICISFLLNHVLSTLFPISVFVVDQNVQRNGSKFGIILEHTFHVGIFSCCVFIFFFFLKWNRKKLCTFYTPKIEEFCWTFCQAQTLKLRRVNMVY